MMTHRHKPAGWWWDDKAERSRRVRFKISRVT
jgi:hypothetical protein